MPTRTDQENLEAAGKKMEEQNEQGTRNDNGFGTLLAFIVVLGAVILREMLLRSMTTPSLPLPHILP